MNNRRIRKALFEAGMKQYQLADLLGVSESSVSVMLRSELSASEQKRIVDLINGREVHDNETR